MSLAEKTQDLVVAKEQLEYSAHVAEESDKIKERVMRSMRQNTRDSIHTIIKIVDILHKNLNGVLDFEMGQRQEEEMLCRIAQEVRHVERFTSDQLLKELVSPLEVVEECIALYAKKANRRNVTITSEFPKKPLPDIQVDRSRFMQIIMGLLFRSLEFLPAKSHIKVKVKRKYEKKMPVLLVVIEDNGLGLGEKDRDDTRHSYGADDEELNVDGTELPLDLVKELLKLHGGALMINDVWEKGSTVGATFPYQEIKPSPQLSSLPENVIPIGKKQ